MHVMQQNRSGQPADIIAVRGHFHTLIDCKVCENGVFPFERIEENQRSAMHMFFRKAGELCYFALKLPEGEIRMVSLQRLETLSNRGKHRLTEKDFRSETWPLDEWIQASRTWAEDS